MAGRSARPTATHPGCDQASAITGLIRFASFLGDNGAAFYGQVVAHLGRATGLAVEMVADTSAGLDAMLSDGRVDAVFGCGLPYVWKAAESAPSVALLAAPVMPAARYHDQPIYYSDVIVRADSALHTFDDLRGATFAYNQAISFSGYVLPRHHLLETGRPADFFGRSVATGSHAASMDWVEDGRADTAAIDSVVFDMEMAQRPERQAALRVIESLGPAGMPPVMASTRLSEAHRGNLTAALLDMHARPEGRAILERGGVRRFARVTDRNYDGIRQRLRALEAAGVGDLR